MKIRRLRDSKTSKFCEMDYDEFAFPLFALMDWLTGELVRPIQILNATATYDKIVQCWGSCDDATEYMINTDDLCCYCTVLEVPRNLIEEFEGRTLILENVIEDGDAVADRN